MQYAIIPMKMTQSTITMVTPAPKEFSYNSEFVTRNQATARSTPSVPIAAAIHSSLAILPLPLLVRLTFLEARIARGIASQSQAFGAMQEPDRQHGHLILEKQPKTSEVATS
jgi:hypothetical protein